MSRWSPLQFIVTAAALVAPEAAFAASDVTNNGGVSRQATMTVAAT